MLLEAIHIDGEDPRAYAYALALIEVDLGRAALMSSLSVEVGTQFMEMLRNGSAEIIREIKTLADDNMCKDSDEDMSGSSRSPSDATMGSVTISLGSTSDAMMASSVTNPCGSASDVTMATSSGRSTPGSSSDESMP